MENVTKPAPRAWRRDRPAGNDVAAGADQADIEKSGRRSMRWSPARQTIKDAAEKVGWRAKPFRALTRPHRRNMRQKVARSLAIGRGTRRHYR